LHGKDYEEQQAIALQTMQSEVFKDLWGSKALCYQSRASNAKC
jgi:hypothetical protein